MPQVIPPTQTTDNYSPSGFQYPASESGGNPYVSGYIIIAPISSTSPTTGVWVSVLVGPNQGQAQWQEEIPVPPGVLPLQMNIAAGTPDYIYGIRTRNIIAGTNAICSGALYAPGEVAMIPQAGGGVGPPFSQTVGGIIFNDFVFANANTAITGIGFNSQTNKIIQGNLFTLTSPTQLLVEFFTPAVEADNGPNNQALGFELWDGVLNKGTIAYCCGNINAGNCQLLNCVKAEAIITLAAGSHTLAIYAWRNVAGGGTITVYANTFADGSGNFGPSWYRVSSAT